MGVYYYLWNDTKHEKVHLAYHIKRGPMTQNDAVHFALCHYMISNLGDVLRLCGDDADKGEGESYAEVNLLTYEFSNPSVIVKIVELLNGIYGLEQYSVVGGIGVDRAEE